MSAPENRERAPVDSAKGSKHQGNRQTASIFRSRSLLVKTDDLPLTDANNVIQNGFLLSIITINRNNAINLARTLSSLFQVLEDRDVECIFIDGASTDDSLSIAKTFWSESNIISEPDSGIYNAMNKGLSIASGKFVLWLNSGDELIAGAWVAAKKEIQTTDASVISCGLEIYNESGTELLERRLPNEKMLPRQTLPHPSSIFRRDDIIGLGGYDESFKIAADRFLFLKLHQQGAQFVYSKTFLSKFYLGGVSSNLINTYFENKKIDNHFNIINPFIYALIKIVQHGYSLFLGKTA